MGAAYYSSDWPGPLEPAAVIQVCERMIVIKEFDTGLAFVDITITWLNCYKDVVEVLGEHRA